MGKQGRRKQRQKRKQQERVSNIGDNSVTTSVNPSSAVHQLRHPDPKIRQNALIALQATFIHSPNSSSSSSSSRRISPAVLQAIREQVMDPSFECACAAAECLAQYLSHYSTPSTMEHDAMTTATWAPVLVTRLDQCLEGIRQASEQSSSNKNSKNSNAHKLKSWYAVAASCAKALCRLVELNEKALDQIMDETTTILPKFVSSMLGLLHSAATFERSTDTRFNEFVEETANHSARCLHSSLDENPELVDRIIAASAPDMAVSHWSLLLTKLPKTAALHVCGSLVTIYQINPAPWQSRLMLDFVIPYLQTSLVVQPDQLQSIEQAYKEALVLHKKQKEDQQLEDEIVQKVQDRKEPAKLIARRQQGVDRGSKPTIEETKDGEQAMDEAITAWSGIFLPLQVSLEVTANFLTTFIVDEDAMHQDDNHLDIQMRGSIISSRLAESLLKALQVLCGYSSSRGDIPKEHAALTDDLQESISKCAACVTNCILSDILESSNYQATWQSLYPYIDCEGISCIFVVLAQHGVLPSQGDTVLIKRLLDSSNESTQRDGVSLLTALLNNKELSSEATASGALELLRMLNQGQTMAKIEALRAIMDLWGKEEFLPEMFVTQNVLSTFQTVLAGLSTSKTLDPETEEIFFNAGRFVNYKLGR